MGWNKRTPINIVHPLYEHYCQVRGRTSVGPGKKSEVKEARTKEGIPARNIRLSKGLVTATSIGISWHHLPSHQWKGDLKNYLVSGTFFSLSIR